MKEKPAIVYVIDSLGRGGAETLLVGILPDIALQYNIILVALSDVRDFDREELKDCTIISLSFKSWFSFIPAVFKLRKILKTYKPVLVHAHLAMSSQVARLANQGRFPFIYSVHSVLSVNVFEKSWLLKKMERLLFDKNDYLIAVSSVVLNDYETHIGKPKNSYVLNNYISDVFLTPENKGVVYTPPGTIKLVAVGNIKRVKNYEYLLHAIKKLGSQRVTLDIFGKGDAAYTGTLQNFIDNNNIAVSLKGSVSGVQDILPHYHFLAMSSSSEGFGIAAVEAMALDIPLLLSDIDIFRNITHNNALFFSLDNIDSFIKIIEGIEKNEYDLAALTANGNTLAKQHYSKEIYIDKLLSLYKQVER